VDFGELVENWASSNETGTLIDLGAVTSLTYLRTPLLADPRVRSWIDGAGTFHLCLDSLDEALPTHFGRQGVSGWYMAPLRQKDVELAAR
jgi:hypothetical protein